MYIYIIKEQEQGYAVAKGDSPAVPRQRFWSEQE